VLEDLTMLGVNEMADSAILIKCFIKTKPLQQWSVKREMLRRLKRRFDELGIEIPFPHRTVFVRHEGPVAGLEKLATEAQQEEPVYTSGVD
jgi:small conductance mechanosensitive channel